MLPGLWRDARRLRKSGSWLWPGRKHKTLRKSTSPQSELGRRLRLGSDPGRLIRRWEAGDVPVSGPASVAVEYMIAEHETLADENQ